MPIRIVSTESFADLRESGAYYVDKTGYLEQILEDGHEALMITHPRRFGKTLFLSMLAEFLDMKRDSGKLFAGLKIAENASFCQKWMNRYPVISLTFRGFEASIRERMIKGIGAVLSDFCQVHEYLLSSDSVLEEDRENIRKLLDEEADESTIGRALLILTRALTCHHGKRAVLLIDEYDVPLLVAAERGWYEEMYRFMHMFFSNGLKTNTKNLELGLLVGVLPIPRDSGINNLECYGIEDHEISGLFGFTQEEVDELLVQAGFEEKREVIGEWYNGYRFGNSGDIYNPWSILDYLGGLLVKPSLAPRPSWVSTGRRTLPENYAERLPKKSDVRGKVAVLTAGFGIAAKVPIIIDFVEFFRKEDHFWTLLCLTGYLTWVADPSRCLEENDARDSVLVVPNKEIHEIFEKEAAAWFGSILPEKEAVRLIDALWEQEAQTCEEVLSGMFARDGLSYRNALYVFAMLLGVFDLWNVGTIAIGRMAERLYGFFMSDSGNSRAAVIGLRDVWSEPKLEESAREILNRLEDCSDDARLRAEGCETLLHVGIAICETSVRVLIKDASPGKDRV